MRLTYVFLVIVFNSIDLQKQIPYFSDKPFTATAPGRTMHRNRWRRGRCWHAKQGKLTRHTESARGPVVLTQYSYLKVPA